MNDDFLAELEEALCGDEPDYSAEPGAQVLDSDQATQWMARLEGVRRKAADITAARNAAVERLDRVTNARKANLAQQEAWLEEALTIFHQVMLAEDPEGAKTIVLPTGVLKSGVWGGAEVWNYTDEAAFEAWAIENLPGAVEYPAPKVSKSTAKKLINESKLRVSDGVVQLADSTIVPGLTITERPRAFKAIDNATLEAEAAKKAAAKAAKDGE